MMRCQAFEDTIDRAFAQMRAEGIRLTRAQLRAKVIDAAIAHHGYCVLQDDVSGEMFDVRTGEPCNWPPERH